MPRKKRRAAPKSAEEHTHLAVIVEHHKVSISSSINHAAYHPEYAYRLDLDDPLYRFTMHLEIAGTCTYPEKRAGDAYAVTLYGEDAPSMGINATLKSAQVVDEHYSPVYKSYRGRDVPVFDPPKGMGFLEKVRGEARWTAWLRAQPRFVSDALMLLGQGRSVYLAIRERKEKRTRWVQGLSIQTTDPAEE